jgi:hypothetical protein
MSVTEIETAVQQLSVVEQTELLRLGGHGSAA